MEHPTELNPTETTVHEAIGALPGAEEVFRRHGLDCCCGGGLPIADAAERHGVELEALLDDLTRAGAGG